MSFLGTDSAKDLERAVSPSSSASSVVPFVCFDGYVSDVVGEMVSTGVQRLELSAAERKALEPELAAQAERFRREDEALAAYIARLQLEKTGSSDKRSASSVSSSSAVSSLASSCSAEDDDDSDFDESLLELDPVDYRNHDLYKVLGLEKLREAATAEDIKAAYRRRVLRHHPDKLKQNPRRKPLENAALADDSFFKLIQKAWQVLTDPSRRADYEACNPTFDESCPEEAAISRAMQEQGEDAFYAMLAPVFERNAHWSRKQPVPRLGDASTCRNEVEAFYSFWIGIESRRCFEWLDEEEPAGTENRADKRWHEKKNKAARDRRKREDNGRLVRLVELASRRDPRLARWKEADKAAKNAKRDAKGNATRVAAAAAAEAKALQEAELRAAAAAAEAQKAAKATAKVALKAARKALRDAIGAPDSWVSDVRAEAKTIQSITALIDQLVAALGEDVARVQAAVLHIDQLSQTAQQPRVQLSSALIRLLEAEIKGEPVAEAPNAEIVEPVSTLHPQTIAKDEIDQTATPIAAPAASSVWTLEETDLLINAAKQFPGGTAARWELITAAINRQIANGTCATGLGSGADGWTVEQVIKRAAELRSTAENESSASNIPVAAPAAPVIKKRDPRVDMAEPTIASYYYADDTERATATATHGSQPVSVPVPVGAGDSSCTWSSEDQLALEKALKTVPAADSERWEKVSALVPGKSKKDCITRVKEIAALLKQKGK